MHVDFALDRRLSRPWRRETETIGGTGQRGTDVSRSDDAMLLACKRVIQEHVAGAAVVLFGSRARGDAAPDSDYDLLVLTDTPLTCAEEDGTSDAAAESVWGATLGVARKAVQCRRADPR